MVEEEEEEEEVVVEAGTAVSMMVSTLSNPMASVHSLAPQSSNVYRPQALYL